jgi:hypothetical protein
MFEYIIGETYAAEIFVGEEAQLDRIAAHASTDTTRIDSPRPER